MNSITNRPKEWLEKEKFLGAFFADDYLISNNVPRTFVKGLLESVPARPEKYHSLLNRIYQAYCVLIGKADALYWQESFKERF